MGRRLKVASISSQFHIGGDENRLLAYLAARNRDRFDHLVISGCKASQRWTICGVPFGIGFWRLMWKC